MRAGQEKGQRQDHGLGELLRYENVAWFEDGLVRILDRRVYPTEKRFVECSSVEEVAGAITDMVTQSAGPYTAAGMGMALAAWQVREKSQGEQWTALEEAAGQLARARPTTEARMRRVTGASLLAAKAALARGESDLSPSLFQIAFDSLERRYERMAHVGEHLVSLFSPQTTLMTHCYGETIVGTMIRAARAKGIDLKIFCPETRPYFQGARLTASLAADMGVDVTVITDNMPAELLSHRKIDLFTTAADAITTGGFVVNKTGTLQIAIVAKYYGVPYFVTGIPDGVSLDQITIEERDPEFVLQVGGIHHTKEAVKGYYPAFDITPPHLVTGVVTDLGILTPYNLGDYPSQPGSKADYWGSPVL